MPDRPQSIPPLPPIDLSKATEATRRQLYNIAVNMMTHAIRVFGVRHTIRAVVQAFKDVAAALQHLEPMNQLDGFLNLNAGNDGSYGRCGAPATRKPGSARVCP